VLAVAAAQPAGAVATHDDTVFAFGAATFSGSTSGHHLAKPVVAMAATANGAGYWLLAEDGAVFAYNAPYYGNATNRTFAKIVGMTATTTGHGYWIVAEDGSVFAFGDAHNYGGMNGHALNSKITSLVAGPQSKGYWLYASDGGVFSFGTARFRGSTGGRRLNAPVVGMQSTATGNGYWLVASDGGIFTFGDALFKGSMGGHHLNAPIVGMARTGNGGGYWLAGSDGGVFTFGNAQFKGSALGQLPSGRQVVQLVGMPAGNGYRMLALPKPVAQDVALLAPGATGPAVTYLQYRLASLGYWLPAIDGEYGDLTVQAVYAFQKANGLARTGVVDAPTQATFRRNPRVRPKTTSGHWIEIDKTRQILIIADNGVASYVLNTSTGSDHPYNEGGNSGSAHTPEGVFSVIREVNGPDHGPLGTLWRPKYFTWTGIAVHGYTSVPPYPASHGCARVSNTAMNWIWDSNQMPIGTPVWVYL
jgi:peptidoglycan hydrolase-like protein with peptidoglycan-binding domain